ncbi:MAG: carboxymuconolactone decarboxylase family protein [Prevotella sp.]
MRRTIIFTLLTAMTIHVMAQKKIVQTAGRTQLGEFAPEFAHLNDDILFGEVWSRNDLLSMRDRSLVTLTSLISQGITDSSLTYHLQEAKKNGITRTEISEIITHIAFYAGWPKAWAAFRLAKEVWTEASNTDDAKARFLQEMIFPIGEPNTAYARYFTGDSHLAPIAPKNLSADEKTIQGYSNVTFEPGCRNNWHIHHGAHQILICVSGKGWYQEWGKPAIPLKAGDIIDIPEGVKHWHGAQADSWFQHLATHAKTSGEERNEWLEPVSDEEYNKLK